MDDGPAETGQSPVVPSPSRPLDYASPHANRSARLIWPVRVLLIIMALAVAVRLARALTLPTDNVAMSALPDQREYLDLGRHLFYGHDLFFVDERFKQVVRAFRMPGYPMLIAICGGKVQIVRAAQALLDASSVAAVFLIGRRLKGDATALLAATLVAIHPYLIYFSGTLLSETLFTAVATWGVYLLLRTPAKLRFYGVALLTLSVYVRPSAIGLGITAAAAAYSLTPAWRKAVLRNGVASIIATIGLVLVLAPWAMRNQIQLGCTIWTTTNGGFTAYDSFNPVADGSSDQDALFDVATLAPQLATEGRPVPAEGFYRGTWFVTALTQRGEVGRSQFYQHAAWRYARTHPGRVVELAVAKLARFWSPIPLSADFGGRWLYVIVGGLYVVPLFIFAAIGVWRGKLPRRAKLILLLPAIYFSAVHCVFVGSLRYRVPCDVPLAVLAAAGVMSFVKPKATDGPAVTA